MDCGYTVASLLGLGWVVVMIVTLMVLLTVIAIGMVVVVSMPVPQKRHKRVVFVG